MKKERKLVLKFMLLIALGLSLPAITSSPTFTNYAAVSVESDNDNGPSDNGGQKPVEAPKGGGSTLDKLIESAKNILGGLLSGWGPTDTSRLG